MFEKVYDFPDLGTVVSGGDPFFSFVVYVLARVLMCMFDFSFLKRERGNLLLLAMARIFCHYVFFLV
jgi:hypothetical protein